MRAFTVIVLATTLAAIGAQSASPRSRTIRMERTPAYVLGYCKKSVRLLLACPHLLPRMSQPSPHWEVNLCLVRHTGCAGLTWDDLSLVDGGNGTRPPVWSHVIVQAGSLRRAFPFLYPTRGRRISHLDGLFSRSRTHAIFVGTFTWGGRKGTVILAPEFPAGGEQGGHLIFRWRSHGTDFAVGLHGWEPLSQTFSTLRQMITSI